MKRLATFFSHACCCLLLLGMCVNVHDGDTISVQTPEGTFRVRVVSIDCPELGQAYGEEALQTARALCYQQYVELEPLEVDNYGRLVARVYLPDGRDFGREMVCKGYAWYFGRYHQDATLKQLQWQARQNKLGLWQDDKPMPPWKWRRLHPRK